VNRKIHLPGEIVPIPLLFQAAGYFTSNGDFLHKRAGLGKKDYNFEWDESMYDGAYYGDRDVNQPFFSQLQLLGVARTVTVGNGLARLGRWRLEK
jgi:hypothetical protein